MSLHRIKKGLDLPIAGAPEQSVQEGRRVTRVGVMADDFPGMKPRMQVEEGQTVKRGQVLFEDRTNPGVLHTAPAAGRIVGIFRGPRRVLRSVVVHLSESEQAGVPGDDEFAELTAYEGRDVDALTRENVQALMLEAGLWSALRTRPFSVQPKPGSAPHAIFVNGMDTQPLSPAPQAVLAERRADFDRGLRALCKLTDGPTYLCVAPGSGVADGIGAAVQVEEFSGPHPAGTAGVHVHTLAPVSRQRVVWTIGCQDAAALGGLVATGRLPVERIVSLAGPAVTRPRLLRTRSGASIDELTQGELASGDLRVISGSVLSGKRAMGNEFGFLGRFDQQVSAVREGREREFLGWLGAGKDKFSILPLFVSKLLRGKRFDMTTSTYGSPREMVPLGLYERIMPMDIIPTFLLRSMAVGDVEQAEKLGALELDEEDLALCTFVDPGKTEWGPILRRNLQIIQDEG
jgi:Na+-transporting NADH:ubiquinone oxidoreductase subunit A